MQKKETKPKYYVGDNPADYKIMDNPITDPLGMWTGIPDDPYDVPVQDADDL